MTRLSTGRLDLIALTFLELSCLLESPAALAGSLGLRFAPGLLDDPVPRAIGMKLEKMAQTAEQDHPWFTYWLIVVRAAGVGAGLVGMKGLPDAAGEVEIGYGIDPAFRGQGHMTEAVQALIAWAFAHPGCRSIVAINTLASNVASHRILQKVGMQVYEETGGYLSWRLTRPAGS